MLGRKPKYLKEKQKVFKMFENLMLKIENGEKGSVEKLYPTSVLMKECFDLNMEVFMGRILFDRIPSCSESMDLIGKEEVFRANIMPEVMEKFHERFPQYLIVNTTIEISRVGKKIEKLRGYKLTTNLLEFTTEHKKKLQRMYNQAKKADAVKMSGKIKLGNKFLEKMPLLAPSLEKYLPKPNEKDIKKIACK